MRLWLMSAAAAAAALFAQPALAGPAACFWDHLPQAKRDQVMAAYERSLQDGLEVNIFSDQDFETAYTACVGDRPGATAAGGAIAGYEMETATGLWLMRTLGVDQAALDAAWPEVAEHVRTAMNSSHPDKDQVLSSLARRYFASLMNGRRGDLSPSRDELRYVLVYLTGRQIREQEELQFAT